MSESALLSTLIRLSHTLGRPENDYAILAEGNTSTRIDEDSFWVKASGSTMGDINAPGFVAMRFGPVLELLYGPTLSDTELKAALNAAKVDPTVTARPSIEVVLHALMLTVGGAKFVGHTHPTAWNAILCSQGAQRAASGRIFPDHVVVCGPAAVFVRYTDPGVPLAQEVRQQLLRYMDTYGAPPKEVLLQNHGLIALGQSVLEVERITAMSVKAARIQLGTYALGGPNFLSESDVAHLWQRPDEIERRAKLV